MPHPIDPKIRERIFKNYGGGELSCARLLELLDTKVSPGAVPGRNKLVALLADAKQHRNKAEHTTGSADKTMHYTIFIDGSGYHLRLDQRGIIFQITDNARKDLGVIPPWVPPGAMY